MATRTTGALALRPTGNAQGGYYFFSLSTGRILNRNRWTPLPMPAEVIDRVHTLAHCLNTNGLAFGNRDGTPLIDPDDDDEADDPYDPDDESAAPEDDHNLPLDDYNEVANADNVAGVYNSNLNLEHNNNLMKTILTTIMTDNLDDNLKHECNDNAPELNIGQQQPN